MTIFGCKVAAALFFSGLLMNPAQAQVTIDDVDVIETFFLTGPTQMSKIVIGYTDGGLVVDQGSPQTGQLYFEVPQLLAADCTSLLPDPFASAFPYDADTTNKDFIVEPTNVLEWPGSSIQVTATPIEYSFCVEVTLMLVVAGAGDKVMHRKQFVFSVTEHTSTVTIGVSASIPTVGEDADRTVELDESVGVVGPPSGTTAALTSSVPVAFGDPVSVVVDSQDPDYTLTLNRIEVYIGTNLEMIVPDSLITVVPITAAQQITVSTYIPFELYSTSASVTLSLQIVLDWTYIGTRRALTNTNNSQQEHVMVEVTLAPLDDAVAAAHQVKEEEEGVLMDESSGNSKSWGSDWGPAAVSLSVFWLI